MGRSHRLARTEIHRGHARHSVGQFELEVSIKFSILASYEISRADAGARPESFKTERYFGKQNGTVRESRAINVSPLWMLDLDRD